MSTKINPGQEPSLAGDLRFVLQVFRAKALLIATCVSIAAIAGFLYARTSPKVYAAKTTLQVEQAEQRVLKIEGVTAEDLKSPEVLKTYEQNILSSEVVLGVIRNHGLMDDPAFLPEVVDKHSEDALQTALTRHIAAKIRRDTRLIDITVEHSSPALAKRIAELLVEEFTRWSSQARREAGQAASSFLLERAAELNERLAKSERALQAYKEQNEGVTLEERQNITAEQLNQLNLRVTAARVDRLKLEADCADLSKTTARSAVELLAIPAIASAPEVAYAKKQIGEKEALLATLSQRYKELHPKFIAAKSELGELRTGLTEAIRKAADVLATQYQSARLTETKLEEALREQQKVALNVNSIAIGYTALAREVESNRTLYESVLTRMKETDLAKDLAQDHVRVVARALMPQSPVRPRKTLIFALSVIAGLGVGCFLAFASHAANRSLHTLQDAEARLGLRSLGEIPRHLPAKSERKNSTIIVESDLAAVESFRTLRTSLSLLGNEPEPKTILFTSAHPAEGKTFCAINCAVSFAQLGLKTLLVDADFRLPQVERVFFGGHTLHHVNSAPADGLAHPLIQPTHIANLSVVSASAAGPNTAESFDGVTFEQFLRRNSDEFDRIVVDSAPVQLVSDTLHFVKHVQAVCLVIHAGQTPAEDVLRTAERLAEAGAPLVGFVWNQVRPRKIDHGYYARASQRLSA